MLKRALESLLQQTLDKSLYEIIVVDNASVDDTPDVVREFSNRYPVADIKLVHEDKQGLGYARNAGFRHARGTNVAFMDDDAKASPDWLETALQCFEEVRPTPLAIGGRILPLYESPKPEWFKDEYEIRSWGEEPRFLKHGESFSGSNMVFSKKALEEHGGFNVHVGVKGKYLSVGEETALFDSIWQRNGNARVMYYSPKLVVWHSVPDFKMTPSYHLKRAFATGQASHIMHGPISVPARLYCVTIITGHIVRRSILALLRWRKYQTYQNWLVEELAPITIELGRLASYLGLHIRVKQG